MKTDHGPAPSLPAAVFTTPLAGKLIHQIHKDFGYEFLEREAVEDPQHLWQAIERELHRYPTPLGPLLYRIDIAEQELQSVRSLKDIGALILKREAEKVLFRNRGLR